MCVFKTHIVCFRFWPMHLASIVFNFRSLKTLYSSNNKQAKFCLRKEKNPHILLFHILLYAIFFPQIIQKIKCILWHFFIILLVLNMEFKTLQSYNNLKCIIIIFFSDFRQKNHKIMKCIKIKHFKKILYHIFSYKN